MEMILGAFLKRLLRTPTKNFKKNKVAHSLTSSDLRLCAYLRLNLSSKEIAPLLNISVRSVEIKDIVCVKNGLVA
jgi:DNA-binding CsgD family transcriptional regulator